METKIKMELVPTTAGEAVARVEAAKLSDVTKNLIKCRAMVSDLWGYVVTSYTQAYPFADDVNVRALDNFKDLCNQLGNEKTGLIGDVIEANMGDMDFTEI